MIAVTGIREYIQVMNKKSISKLVTKAEKLIIKWLKPLPRLPKTITKWVSENIWWIVAIGMALTILAAFLAFVGISAYLSFVGNSASYIGIYSTPVYSGLWLLNTILALAVMIVIAYIYSRAITPLKTTKAQGWRLLLVALLISAVWSVVSAALSLNVFTFVFSVIFSAIGVAISAYLLFEIRHYFVKD